MEAIVDLLLINSDYPLIVVISKLLILAFGLLTMLLMGYIFVNRGRVHHRQQKDESLIEEYEDEIIDILIGELKKNDPATYQDTVERLRIAFSGEAIQTLRKLMALLGRDMSGDNAFLLQELYTDLQLERRSVKTLNNGSWEQKVMAVKELGRFGVVHALPQLQSLAENPNKILRDEVQYTLLQLGGASQFEFLTTLNEPLTPWQQIRITEVFRLLDPQDLPDFQVYLSNQYEEVTIFLLKLIKFFDQTQAREAVVDQLFDERPLVKLEAVNTLAGWLDEETVELLIILYEESGLNIRIAITKALQQWTYDQNTRYFLEGVLEETQEYTLCMSALQSLKKLGGEEAIIQLLDTTSVLNNRYIAHQLDERI